MPFTIYISRRVSSLYIKKKKKNKPPQTTEMPTTLSNLPNWSYFYLGISGSQGQPSFSNPHVCLPVIFFIQKRNSVKQVCYGFIYFFHIYGFIYIMLWIYLKEVALKS